MIWQLILLLVFLPAGIFAFYEDWVVTSLGLFAGWVLLLFLIFDARRRV